MDDYRAENPANDAAQVNEFDFSTVNNVALTVDYSACDPVTPVFFRVYNEDPFEGDELNKNIKPIYSNFTDANGRFSQTIELPSYADDLYIFTGDFFIDEQLMNAKVTDNRAIAKANSSQAAAARRRVSPGSGVLTDDMTYLYQTSYEVDFTTGDNTGNQIYNDWKTWLGKWDSRTGRPDYLLNSDDPSYAALTFTEEEMLGIRQSIAAAVVRKQECPMEFRQEADLTLQEDAVVSVTLVGSNTCWNNCLGYYYYQGDAPTDLKNIHVVMLFPNTQDGHSQFINTEKYKSNYNGNIALERGDAVKLIYYPQIAEGKKDGATLTFPAGTKIGFLLKSNGWGMQKPRGNVKYYNAYKAGKVKPFIYRNEADSKRWEVHIAKEAPTAKMNMSYFGTEDDKSDLSKKLYYVGSSNYPFAFKLAGVGIDAFKNTILKRANESKAIDVFFPDFLEWSKSNGAKKKDWYLHPNAE